MPPPETGRQRAARIPLDYYKHTTPLDRGRGWRALALAALLTLGAAATGWFAGSQGQGYYSRGPVAAVHATWEDNCTACHTPFTPITGEAWPGRFIGDVHELNQKCETCHAGTVHHVNQNQELACASCHHDHRGRDASLVRVADADCLRCHREIAKFTKDGEHLPANVTGFLADQHPPFQMGARAPDPTYRGKITFSHQLHLSPGIAIKDGKNPTKVSDIADPAERERYRGAGPDDDRVQLDCASCHQLDRDGRKPARSAGANLLPVSYADHCKTCHPLGFDDSQPHLNVPHRMQPPELHLFLSGLYLNRLPAAAPDATERQPPPRIRPDHPRADDADALARRVQVLERVKRAESALYYGGKGCGLCHQYLQDVPGDDPLAAPRSVLPSPVEGVWLTRAKFNHVAHRAVNCKECHARAYPDAANVSRLKDEIVTASGPGGKLSGLRLCQECHAPATVRDGQPHGGARYDCVECHRYHNGDHALGGLGAKERGARQPGGIAEFLSGGRPGGAKSP